MSRTVSWRKTFTFVECSCLVEKTSIRLVSLLLSVTCSSPCSDKLQIQLHKVGLNRKAYLAPKERQKKRFFLFDKIKINKRGETPSILQRGVSSVKGLWWLQTYWKKGLPCLYSILLALASISWQGRWRWVLRAQACVGHLIALLAEFCVLIVPAVPLQPRGG